MVNKVICIALVSAFSVLLPIVLDILLFLGGIYLSFEGVEKVVEKLDKKKKDSKKEVVSENKRVWEQ